MKIRRFWARGYYVDIVGKNQKQIQYKLAYLYLSNTYFTSNPANPKGDMSFKYTLFPSSCPSQLINSISE